MTDDQPPATPLERAVHEFLERDYPTAVIERREHAIVPVSALNGLRWAIDPERPSPRPFVSYDPAMRGGRPTLNGTRLDVAMIASIVWQGWDEEKIRRDGWPDLTRLDILTAAWFWGLHGGRTWKRRWGAWANEAHGALHGMDAAAIAAIPWPPCLGDARQDAGTGEGE